MEKQFAASEVRRLSNRIPRSNDEIADAQEALHAFADMLEAQEKAVPVGYITNVDVQELKANRKDKADGVDAIEVLIHSHPFASNHIAIYAHTAPSDTARLAEALRNARGFVLHFGDEPARVCIAEIDAALAAHSAQAQPPAASVTDAMVKRAVMARMIKMGYNPETVTYSIGSMELMRAALEAALAAQENPNE